MKLSPEISFIDIHTHSLKRESDVFEIVNLFPEQIDPVLFNISSIENHTGYSIGWHPWHLTNDQIKTVIELLVKASPLVSVIAIGECGLDLRSETPLSLQIDVFKEHARIAATVNKPLLIHCVRAFNELIRLKKELMPTIPWIVHGFNANLSIGKELIRHGFYFSLGKALLDADSNAAKLLPDIATDHLFLETDDSDVNIKMIYQQAAFLMKVDVEQIKKRILANYYTSFNVR